MKKIHVEEVPEDLSWSHFFKVFVIILRSIIGLEHFLLSLSQSGTRGGLMVSALDSGPGGPGSSSGRGHCVVFLGKTRYSHSASTQVY